MKESYADRRAVVEETAKAALKDEAENGPGRHGVCLMPDGMPVLAKHKISPVMGSTMLADNTEDHTGVCPLCGTRAKLHSIKKVLLKHVMRGENLPASPALSEPNIQPTDTGANTGDPLAGSERRADAIDGAWERGTVSLSQVGEDGKRERVDVPATLDNLREALSQEIKRRKRLRSLDSIKTCDALVLSLRRKVKAAEEGKEAFDGPSADASMGVSTGAVGVSAGQRDEARIPGVALVQGRTEGTLTQEQWQAQQTGKPGPTTLDAPLGRERPDAGALGAPTYAHSEDVPSCAAERCEHIAHGKDKEGRELTRGGYLTYAEYSAQSPTQQRRYRERVANNRRRIERANGYAARRPVVRQGQPFGCKALVDAVNGSSLHETASVMSQAPGGNSARMDRIASRS